VGDVDEVLEELRRDVLVGRVLPGQLERDREHVQAVHAHPGGAVRLLDAVAGRQRCRTVEDADVVEPEEATLEDVLPLGVLPVHPPGEVEQQLVEDLLEELAIALAAQPALDSIDAQRRPGVDGGFTSPNAHS